jgi:serine/threonine protein kinase
VRGDVKLFDFGLSTEVTKDTVKLSDGTYQLTGQTGSPRYMAPEVGNELPYNEKCDVYSMAIMLWQMLTCRTPYLTCTPSTMKDLVYSGDTRPSIPEDWSRVLKLLLRRGWTADIPSRFNMKNFEDTLKTEITHLRGGDASGLEHTRRRSTFVFRGGKIPKSSEFNI